MALLETRGVSPGTAGPRPSRQDGPLGRGDQRHHGDWKDHCASLRCTQLSEQPTVSLLSNEPKPTCEQWRDFSAVNVVGRLIEPADCAGDGAPARGRARFGPRAPSAPAILRRSLRLAPTSPRGLRLRPAALRTGRPSPENRAFGAAGLLGLPPRPSTDGLSDTQMVGGPRSCSPELGRPVRLRLRGRDVAAGNAVFLKTVSEAQGVGRAEELHRGSESSGGGLRLRERAGVSWSVSGVTRCPRRGVRCAVRFAA